MKLSKLLEAIEPITVDWQNPKRKVCKAEWRKEAPCTMRQCAMTDLPDADIGSIHYRAQEVLPGGMFVAIEGQTADGHDFMHQALKRGAAAIIAQKEPPQPFLNECIADSAEKPADRRHPGTRYPHRTGRSGGPIFQPSVPAHDPGRLLPEPTARPPSPI